MLGEHVAVWLVVEHHSVHTLAVVVVEVVPGVVGVVGHHGHARHLRPPGPRPGAGPHHPALHLGGVHLNREQQNLKLL